MNLRNVDSEFNKTMSGQANYDSMLERQHSRTQIHQTDVSQKRIQEDEDDDEVVVFKSGKSRFSSNDPNAYIDPQMARKDTINSQKKRGLFLTLASKDKEDVNSMITASLSVAKTQKSKQGSILTASSMLTDSSQGL